MLLGLRASAPSAFQVCSNKRKVCQVLLYTQMETVEPDALEQLKRLASSSLPVGYVSAMPDTHLGKGVTVRQQ